MTSASLNPSGDLQEGDSVTLTCSSDANPPVHNYTWYRKTGDETVLQGTGRMLNLTLNLVPGVDGLYYCEVQNKGHSDRVYGNVSTIPMVSGCGQGVPADHKDDEDDVQYTSVQFKPNKQREAPSQEEKVEYASVQFKPNKQREVPSQEERHP
ncbi:hypothetical protein AALO_G00097110 [Alosa alosa]|uniref:Ig-like domain-containing protein n=1 Tax=Alosa alosa TaxID=278164 RepID=A0AAV6GXM2_9TELE|nr:hypothetical protein AALO_G00097110 [Alosa alosa]